MMMIEIALKGAAVFACAGILTMRLRRSSAAVRHLVWSVAVATVLALPALLELTPRSAVFVAHDSTVGGLLAAAADSTVAGLLAANEDSTLGGLLAPLAAPRAAQIPATPEAGVARAARPQTAAGFDADLMIAGLDAPNRTPPGAGVRDSASSAGRPYPRSSVDAVGAAALAIWLTGMVIVLTTLVAERLRLSLLGRAACPATESAALEALERLCREAGVLRPPRLRIGSPDSMPMTWGTLRPVVLLPAGFARWTAARLDTVLRHEIAHVRRRDDLPQAVATIVAALHWFNPLAWLAVHRLRVEREHACDDEVLRRGSRPSVYAKELLGIAREFRAVRATALAAQTMARPSQLSLRVRAVLEESRSRRAVRRRHVLVATAVGLLLALPLSAAGIAVAQEATPGSPPPTTTNMIPSGDAMAAGLLAEASGGGLPPIAASPKLAPPSPAQQPVSECWAPGVARSASNNHDTDAGVSTFVWSSENCRGEIRLEGELFFDDEVTEIVGMSAGGRFRIEVEENGSERRLEITTRGGGGLDYAWLIDGRSREFDADARQWLSNMLAPVLRATGIAAEQRATAIYRRQGADGVLAEVALMTSNSTMSRYLIALSGQPALNDADLSRVLSVTAADIDSNSAKARVLGAVGRRHRDAIVDGPVEAAFWASTATIDSNSTLSRLLSDLIQGEPQDSALVTRSLREAGARIDSSSTLARFLLKLKRDYPGIATSGPQATLFWETLDRVDSNSTLRGLLLEMTAGETVDSALLPVVFETARTRVDSDRTLSDFLLNMDSAYPGISASGPLTEAFWETVRRIDSDSTLSRLLVTLAAGKDDDSPVLDQVLEEGSAIDSDSQKRRFLLEFAGQHRGAARGRLNDKVLQAARGIESRSNRERTLEGLRDLGIG